MLALIAENDSRLGFALLEGLERFGIAGELVGSAREVLHHAAGRDYAAIVLDSHLPDCDAPRLCERIRLEEVGSPIIVLTDHDSIDDRVAGLESGADDCVTWPISIRELAARIRAVGRRGPMRNRPVLVNGDLRLDRSRHQVWRGDAPIELTMTEFALFEVLMRNPGAALPAPFLLEQAWGYASGTRSNVVQVYIRYLREKIDRPFSRHSIQTVRGAGYRLVGDD